MLYELTVIMPDSATELDLEEITRIIKRHSYSIEKFEDDGVKRLNYRIDTHWRGHYYWWLLDMPNGEPAKLSSELNINDNALRHLLVKSSESY